MRWMGQQILALELFIVTQEQRHLSHDLEHVAVCHLVGGKAHNIYCIFNPSIFLTLIKWNVGMLWFIFLFSISSLWYPE